MPEKPRQNRKRSISLDIERTVRRIDSRDFGYSKNVLNARRVVRHRPRDATVYAKDVLVNDRRQGQAIKDCVAGLPETVAQIVTEAVAALKNKGSLSVVFLPPVHVAGFVVASEQKHLGGERLFHGQQVGDRFETTEASIDVITEKQKVSRRQTHAEAPDIVGEKMQIFQIAVNIAKHVAGALQKYHAWFLFQQVFAMFAQFQQVFGKLLRIQVIHVLRGVLKHVENALNGRRDRVTLLALRRHKIIQNTTRGNARGSPNAFALCRNGALVAMAGLHFAHVDRVRRQGIVASFLGRGGDQLRLELLRKLGAALLQVADLLLLFTQARLRFGREQWWLAFVHAVMCVCECV